VDAKTQIARLQMSAQVLQETLRGVIAAEPDYDLETDDPVGRNFLAYREVVNELVTSFQTFTDIAALQAFQIGKLLGEFPPDADESFTVPRP
jgi:hypothetical protein